MYARSDRHPRSDDRGGVGGIADVVGAAADRRLRRTVVIDQAAARHDSRMRAASSPDSASPPISIQRRAEHVGGPAARRADARRCDGMICEDVDAIATVDVGRVGVAVHRRRRVDQVQAAARSASTGKIAVLPRSVLITETTAYCSPSGGSGSLAASLAVDPGGVVGEVRRGSPRRPWGRRLSPSVYDRRTARSCGPAAGGRVRRRLRRDRLGVALRADGGDRRDRAEPLERGVPA